MITVPTIGQTGWGPVLNTALENLDARLEHTARDVKAEFGAAGDGATDDTAAVAAAIAAGGVTLFPPGTYICTTLQPETGTVLQGVGRSGYIATPSDQASTIKLKNGTNAALISGADQVSNVVIRNLNLDGNKANNTSGNIIDLVAGGAQDTAWHVEDCFLDNSANDGISIGTGRQAVRVSRTWIMRSDNNGAVLNGNDSGLSNVLIGLSGSNSIYIGASLQHLSDCDVWSSTGAGIVVDGATMVSLSGIGIDRHQREGVIVLSGGVTIRGCLFHSNSQLTNATYAHIRVDAGQAAVLGCEFGSDGFVNNPNYAIAATGTAQVQESSNSVVSGSVTAGFFSDVTKVMTDAPGVAAYDQGFLTWTQPPPETAGGFGLTAGIVYLSKVKITRPQTASVISYGVTTAAVGGTAGQNFVGLYNSAGTRLAASTDQTTNFGTAGLKTAAITPQLLTPGYYYVAFLANYATSAPSVVGGGGVSSSMNAGLTAGNARSLTSGTAQTALPASITLSSGTLNIALRWGALS